MKKRSAKALQQMFQHRDDAQLKRDFDAIGTHSDHRVKTGRKKGCVKLSYAKHGDDILAEQKRRREVKQHEEGAKIVQLSDDGHGEFSVAVVLNDGELSAWGSYDDRAAAELAAKTAAKAYGCSWETNY